MGKYTSLAHKFRDKDPQGGGGVEDNTNIVYRKSRQKYKELTNEHHSPVDTSLQRDTNLRTTNLTNLINDNAPATNLRTTNLTNLFEEPCLKVCIHRLRPDDCCVCNGYARWLTEDEERLQRAIADPAKVRAEYRELDDWKEV